MKEFPSHLLLFLTIPLLLIPGGCSTSTSVVTGEPRDPIDPSEVKIYRVEPEIFEEIAIVEATSKGSIEFSEQGKIDLALDRLKEKAAELGANGILMTGVTDGYGGSFSIGLGGGSYSGGSGGSVGASTSKSSTYKIASGIAIYVSEQ
jgi:hypothetical protein